MLDDMLRQRILGLVEPRRVQRNLNFDLQLRARINRLALQGLLRSGNAILEVGRLSGAEITIRVREWHRSIQRVVVDRRVVPYDDLGAELKDFLQTLVNDDHRQITEILLRHAKAVTPRHEDIEQAKANGLAEVNGELDLFLDRLERAMTPEMQAGVTTVNVNAPSIIQTGANSSVAIRLTLTVDARAAIDEVLARAEDLVTVNPSAPEATDIREFSEDIRGELGRPEPRVNRLFAALQGLAATVQGMASGAQVSELIRNGITLLGG